MAGVENVEEMVGTREAAAVATESGGAVATDFGGDNRRRDGGDSWRRDGAIGGVMYAHEGPYTIDVRHVEEMVGTT